MAAAVRDGTLSARELLEQHVARIEARNPELNAIVIDTLEQARREAAAPRSGPLQGVPFTVKEAIDTVGVPYVEEDEDRFTIVFAGRGTWKVIHLTAHFGYQEKQNVPAALRLARKQGLLERSLDLEHASYFVSRIAIKPTDAPGMRPWRKRLFIAMARNASSPIDHFGLPGDRTLILGSQVAL